ncbi:MAG: hypothetical protein KJT03_21845, partial [Verrucomicrobiae bacterium]|nr:hypothetical protein [Verrucomicrobiae bacterium]
MQLLNRFHRIGELFLLCALWPWLSFANSPGVDDHTVALWLFDEPTYPNVILTDAGPRGYDLRLQSSYAAWSLKTEGKGAPPIAPLHLAGKYGLIPGKFGNALYNPKSADAQVIWPDNRQRYSSTSMLGYVDKVPERLNLGYYDWTIEFWFKARGPQTEAATLFRVRNEQDYPRGLPMENALRLMPGRSAFLLQSRTTTDSQRDVVGDPGTHFSFDIPIPTDTRLLNDGDWHHIAFCYQADRRQILHYVDGRQQPLPETGGFLPMIGVLTEFTVSENCEGMLDEYRVSDNVRYPGNFTPPESFSRNYGTAPKTSPEPEGPPLLFANNRDPSQPYDLGSRKHVLIDGALVESLDKLEFRPQSPQIWQETDFRNSEPW